MFKRRGRRLLEFGVDGRVNENVGNTQMGVSHRVTENQVGEWEVMFNASDGLLSSSQTVVITVKISNQAPVLNFPQNVTITEKEVLSLPVSATDPDGDAVMITASNLPSGASFNGSTLTWRTFFHDFGTYEITFTASDGLAEQSAVLTLTVLPAKPANWYRKN